MKIAIDAMGGDFAPLAPVKGALLAREKYADVELVLVGREDAIRKALRESGASALPEGVTIRNASEVVEIADDPATAFKKKPDSSLTVGLNMVRDGEADGFVSAGSTGALLAGATLVVKRIRGLRRAALAPTIPTSTGRAVLLDCGANAECTVEYLLQFAYLGSYYAAKVLGVGNPRVGLLNIGAEEEKGDALRRETYQKLSEAKARGDLNFVGNVEAKEALTGACDVIVSDGFSGNVMLKTIEGAGKLMGGLLKGMLLKNAGTKLAALLLRGGLRTFKKTLDPNEVGGTALLGISKPVVKAHGSSNEVAFCNAVRQAAEVAQSGIAADIARDIDKMRVDRFSGAES
ncbi:MAG: phosphate acyltransferase PlsX [Oscillospiraceae bacterium]|nr:phosphate acyltransferase PlsX [Oscillospiraceae bacterium]